MAEDNTQTETPPEEKAATEAPSTEGTDTSQSDEDGFDAAFTERASGQDGEDAIETQTDGDEPSTNDEPAPVARSEEAPADDAATDKPNNDGATAFDPWAGMSPEQIAHFKSMENSERSNRGRVSALTKKLNSAPKAAAPAPEPSKEETASAPNKETATPAEGEETASELDARLQEAVSEYGDVLGPVADILKDVRSKVDALETDKTTKEEVDAEAEEMTAALGKLETAHPDYQQVAKDNSFLAWLADQSPKVGELANSYDPEEVSLTLTLYKTERAAALAVQSANEEGDLKANANKKRARQLEGNRQVTTRNAPAATSTPDDFDAAFAARAKKHGKK